MSMGFLLRLRRLLLLGGCNFFFVLFCFVWGWWCFCFFLGGWKFGGGGGEERVWRDEESVVDDRMGSCTDREGSWCLEVVVVFLW